MRLVPELAWKRALVILGCHARVVVEENAAFERYEGGVLHLAVREEMWIGHIRERLREVDFTPELAGFRNVDVHVAGAGRTGREVRSASDQRRRSEALDAARRSPGMQRLLAAFDGRIETVEARGDGDKPSPGEEEIDD